MSSNSWVNYLIGAVVGIVVGVLTFGIGLAAYAGTAGLLAFSLSSAYLNATYASKQGDLSGIKSAAAKEIEFTAASEAIAVPVIFGTSRVAGNILRFDSDTFRAVPVKETVEGGGGKGGGGGEDQEIITGYHYYLTYIVGLCVGPIDKVGKVWDGNNMLSIGTGTDMDTYGIGVPVKGKDYSGTIYVSPGGPDDNYTGPYSPVYTPGNPIVGNFRNVVVAAFNDFFIGTSPVPRTMLYEVTRWPRCLGEDGLPVPGLWVTGAKAPGTGYVDANPAAILWELFTNPIWGAGLPPAQLDVASFVECSEYFAENKIGLSFTLETQDTLTATVDFIRQHVATIVVWDGSKLFCRCLMDTGNFKLVATIDADQVSKVSFSRPAWSDVANEVRIEFTNRATGYKAEIAHVQDDAAITICEGLVNSQRINLPGFARRELAESQSQRILYEMSYPAANLSFYMNRWAAHLLPGDLFQFRWNEWSDLPANTFWRVTTVSDSEQSSDGIRLTAMEDRYVTAYYGDAKPLQPSVPGFNGDTPISDDDLYLGEDHQLPMVFADMQPLQLWEPNIWMAQAVRLAMVTAQQGSGNVSGVAHYWSPDGLTDFSFLGLTRGTVITGELTVAPDQSWGLCSRAPEKTFRFSINVPATAATLLSSANKVSVNADSWEVPINGRTDLLLIGNEVFILGKVSEYAPGEYTVEAWLRATYGTDSEPHNVGDPVAFIASYNPSAYLMPSSTLPVGEPLDWQSFPTSIEGRSDTGYEWSSPAYEDRSITPFRPEPYSHSVVGTTWAVTFRPRWHADGSGTKENLNMDLGSLILEMPLGYSFVARPYNGGTPTADAFGPSITFAPEDGADPAKGTCSFTFDAPVGTNALRIWTVYNGIQSAAPLILTT